MRQRRDMPVGRRIGDRHAGQRAAVGRSRRREVGSRQDRRPEAGAEHRADDEARLGIGRLDDIAEVEPGDPCRRVELQHDPLAARPGGNRIAGDVDLSGADAEGEGGVGQLDRVHSRQERQGQRAVGVAARLVVEVDGIDRGRQCCAVDQRDEVRPRQGGGVEQRLGVEDGHGALARRIAAEPR